MGDIMMMELDVLEGMLKEVAPAACQELDGTFHDIASLIENEQFVEAMPLIDKALREGRFDIRLICYFLYIHAVEKGIKGFWAIFQLLKVLMSEEWEKISPQEKREQHTEKSLHWLLSRVLKHIEYIDRQRKKGATALFHKYIGVIDKDVVEGTLKAARELEMLIVERWPSSSVQEKLSRLHKWIEDICEVYWQEERRREKQEEAAAAVVEEPPPSSVPSLPGEDLCLLLASEPLTLLVNKLQAFKLLLQQDEYKKASLIADDIAKTISDFNPLTYFPKLFVEHLSLSASYCDALNRDEEWKETHLYRLLSSLYQSDLEAFMQWKR